ncbi:MAG: hypothetical protein ACJAWT_001226 [Glaciecola sp.]|jgi:hypothetical protein
MGFQKCLFNQGSLRPFQLTHRACQLLVGAKRIKCKKTANFFKDTVLFCSTFIMGLKRYLSQVDEDLLSLTILSLRSSASAQSLGSVLAAQKNAMIEIM